MEIVIVTAFTIAAYMLSLKVYGRFKISILNPVLLSTGIIIMLIKSFNIPYEMYEKGSGVITYILGPIVVLLAVPLYKSKENLKKNIMPILAGIFSGILSSTFSVIVMSKMLKLETKILLSLLPKSITSPMAIEVSNMFGGIPGLTVVVVIITGIIGAAAAPLVIKYGNIQNETAKGIGIGTSSHGIGTSKAVEMGQDAGAASGLAMGLTGVISVLLASFFSRFL